MRGCFTFMRTINDVNDEQLKLTGAVLSRTRDGIKA